METPIGSGGGETSGRAVDGGQSRGLAQPVADIWSRAEDLVDELVRGYRRSSESEEDRMDIESLFAQTAAGDVKGVRNQLEPSSFLLHVRNPDSEAWDEGTLLHAAAKHGHLEIVKRLVEMGAEVYSNPMSTYPPRNRLGGWKTASLGQRARTCDGRGAPRSRS